MVKDKIRVKLKAFDHRVIDECCKKILETALSTGAKVSGPVPLPTERKLICVPGAPHVHETSKEHYEILTHKRLIDIIQPTNKTVDSLMHLDLPAGVGIEVKM